MGRRAHQAPPVQSSQCPPHRWHIPGPPFIDEKGVLWPIGDPRRDWTCLTCQARRPDTSAFDEAARLRATWPAAKRAAEKRSATARAKQTGANDMLFAREVMSEPAQAPMRWTNRP